MNSQHQPNPIRAARLGAGDAATSRDLYCSNYKGCMNIALRGDWEGFSCMACPLRGVTRPPRADEYAKRSSPEMV
jgi:hypothetical protein